MHDKSLFKVEQTGDTVIILPLKNMGEFEIANMAREHLTPFEQLVELVDGMNVVIDLSQTDYFGSSTIGLFNRLVTHVHEQSKRIAFCNLSEHEAEVVHITRINKLWEVKPSREEALEYVAGTTRTGTE